MKMEQMIKSLLVGMATGVVFAVLRLPVPAPPVFSGVLGIVGIFLGYKLVRMFF